MTEAEGIVGRSDSSPAADIFRTLVSTFKSNVDDFMLRAEQRYKELDTLVHVHSFCEQVCVIAQRFFTHLTFLIKVFHSYFSCPLPAYFSLICVHCHI